MSFADYYQLGNVVKAHGLKGEVVIILDVDDPSAYTKLESVFIDLNGKPVPFFISSLLLRGRKATISLEGVSDVEAARNLVGKALYLPLSQLPKLRDDQYYYHELVGFEVFDRETPIGPVTQVFEMPTGHMLGVNHQGTEILIPLHDEIVQAVDQQLKRVTTHLPDGLLNIYLDT